MTGYKRRQNINGNIVYQLKGNLMCKELKHIKAISL